MKVFTLVTADDPERLASTLLFLDTVRVGFPTAEIRVFDNYSQHWWHKEGTVWRQKLDKAGLSLSFPPYVNERIHHAEFIRWVVERTDGPYAIIDPDTIWWENCEACVWFGERPPLLAGYYVPPMWNEWAQCPSVARLHTSFLLVRDGEELRKAIRDAYPHSGPYKPFDPFRPQIVFRTVDQPWFYDTCAMLYAAIGGSPFTSVEKDHYDHLNSASFYNEMLPLVDRPEGFRQVHELARTNPQALRGLWREIDVYYARMAERLRSHSIIERH